MKITQILNVTVLVGGLTLIGSNAVHAGVVEDYNSIWDQVKKGTELSKYSGGKNNPGTKKYGDIEGAALQAKVMYFCKSTCGEKSCADIGALKKCEELCPTGDIGGCLKNKPKQQETN